MNVFAGTQQQPRVIASTQSVSCESTLQRRLDTRVSLAILIGINILMVISQSIFTEISVLGLTVAIMICSGIFRATIYWLVFYLIFAALTQLLLMTNNTLLSSFAASFLMYRHVLPAFMFAFNMLSTTRLGELACALQSIKVPPNYAVAICVAFRSLPTLGREFSAVNDAMKTRGLTFNLKSVVCHPAKTAEHFLIPVIARLGTIADELGNAVVARGLGSDVKRTSYYQLKLRAFDIACLLFMASLLVISIFMKVGLL